jgi:23S rRNA (cytosine1962-C5)-methyltransferase
VIGEMLANRVRKTARHLAKWARREHVSCYRVYDRDIPEVPITVDTYDGALVINDYRLESGDDAWLAEAVAAATDALGATEVHVKHRERLIDRRAGHQYEKLGGHGVWRTVHEGGHAFRVNLADYVDTGLFLDHRITRARVAAEPARTMLNLFAYTGSFSVYAAAAGMMTTSVDLSKTYLDWAAENFELNRIDKRHSLVHADVREFLADARATGNVWDIAVVDPPTFSNSKRMDYTWDVQRDHAGLLADVRAVCHGPIWFSTNRRRFKLETTGETVEDLTRETIPPDFRDSKVHHTFRLMPR